MGYKLYKILPQGVLTLSLLLYPILSIILGIVFSIRFKKQYFTYIPIVFTISLILSTQQATGKDSIDIVNYFNFYINSEWSSFKPKYLLYDIIQTIFSKNLRINFQVYTLLIYLFYYFSCLYFAFNFSEKQSKRSYVKLLLILFGVINFVQTGELLRQNITTILTLFSFTFLVRGKSLLFVLFTLLAIGFHHTALLYTTLIVASQFVVPFYFVGLCCVISANFNLNKIITDMTCHEGGLRFLCQQASKFLKLNWNASFKEHHSLLSFGIVSLIVKLRNTTRKLHNLDKVDRLCLLYILFLIGNLSTDHNFIRFINTSSPFFVIIFSRAYDSSLSKAHIFKFIVGIGLLFMIYNTASIYKRATRETYQSRYLYGNMSNLLTMFSWQYFSNNHANPDHRKLSIGTR